jgi:hypothetical protein
MQEEEDEQYDLCKIYEDAYRIIKEEPFELYI